MRTYNVYRGVQPNVLSYNKQELVDPYGTMTLHDDYTHSQLVDSLKALGLLAHFIPPSVIVVCAMGARRLEVTQHGNLLCWLEDASLA